MDSKVTQIKIIIEPVLESKTEESIRKVEFRSINNEAHKRDCGIKGRSNLRY